MAKRRIVRRDSHKPILTDMAWETRSGTDRRYYVKKVRVNGKPTSIYVGAGLLATAIAELDALVASIRAHRALEVDAFGDDFDRADRAVRDLTAAVGDDLRVALEAEGLRYHRGEWHRPRSSKGPTPS